MRSPSTAIAWEMWARYRWWLLGAFIYFLVVVALCHLLPQGTMYSAVRLYLIAPLMAVPLGLVIVFVCGADADLLSSDSLFPQRIFTLPLSSRTLVGWPMLHGLSTMFIVCVALETLLVRTIRPDAPVLWPALLATACLAWLQALAWAPYGLPALRVVVSVPLIAGVLTLPAMARALDVPQGVLAVVLALQIPIAFGLATAAVSRARRGDCPDWNWLIERARGLLSWCRAEERTFRSPGQAQRWLEWRRAGLGLTLIILLATPYVLLASWLGRSDPSLGLIGMWLFSPITILLVPPLMALSAGAETGLFRVATRDPDPCAFLATRPMSCTDFVFAKLATSLRCVIICYAAAFPVFLIVTILTGWQDRMIDGLLYLAGGSVVGACGMALLIVILLPALTWKFTVENIFIGLAGRKWINSIAGPGLAAMLWLVPALGWWISHYPSLVRFLTTAAPLLLVLLVAVKLLLATYAYRRLQKRRLVEPATAKRVAAIWLATVIVVSVLALCLIPKGLMAWHIILCAAILLVPLARLSLAPTALAWNRHR